LTSSIWNGAPEVTKVVGQVGIVGNFKDILFLIKKFINFIVIFSWMGEK
jgi:hypothetical protein